MVIDKLVNAIQLLHELGGTGNREKYARAADDLDCIVLPVFKEMTDTQSAIASRLTMPEAVEQIIKPLRLMAVGLRLINDHEKVYALGYAIDTIESLQAQVNLLTAERDELFVANITRVPHDAYYEIKRRAEAAEAERDALAAKLEETTYGGRSELSRRTTMTDYNEIAAQIWCEPKHSSKEMDADLAESIAAALRKVRDDTIERCAKICEQEEDIYGSDDYATGQPLSSITERLACRSCAVAIRSSVN